MKKSHIHFIGIGGSAMAQLARAFSARGFKVTGSEPHQIFNPIKSYLQKNKIKYYWPFDPKKMGQPDEVVVGNAHYSDTNPEISYAREHTIELEHFPRLVEKYLIKKKSVVVAGTYAKTTMTAMTAYLFDQAGKNPNYMLGGVPLNLKHGARITPPKGGKKNNWSVVEGDEYPAASPWDFSSKFDFYSPKYLILSSAEWDHMDIFKTKKSYVDRFINLVKNMPKDGLIVAKLNGENLNQVLEKTKCKVVYYMFDNKEIKKYRNKEIIYSVEKVTNKNDYTNLILKRNNKILVSLETKILGDFNLENWAGVLALAYELKLPATKIKNAVKNFKGVKRRLETRTTLKGVRIIDDFAHSPSKAKESVKALVKHFSCLSKENRTSTLPMAGVNRPDVTSGHRIFVVFQPNRGGRSVKCIKNYQNVFNNVHQVIIPELTQYKPKPGVKEFSGPELVKHLCRYLRRNNSTIIYIPDDKKIISHLKKSAKSGDVIAFMGSRDFDSMIKKLMKMFRT